MDFAVDGGGGVGGLLVVDLFVGYGVVHVLFDGGVVVAVPAEDSTDGFLCSLHFEKFVYVVVFVRRSLVEMISCDWNCWLVLMI